MKVSFDATLEDFVEVHKRSARPSASYYIWAVLGSVLMSFGLAALFYLSIQDWLIPVAVGTVAVIAALVSVFQAPDKNIREFLKKRVKIKSPVPTEFEITEHGLTSDTLGQKLTQAWRLIEDIEETNDTIYFKNIFGLYSAVRKRGFESDAEMRQFLDLAKRYWSEATIPPPPAFTE